MATNLDYGNFFLVSIIQVRLYYILEKRQPVKIKCLRKTAFFELDLEECTCTIDLSKALIELAFFLCMSLTCLAEVYSVFSCLSSPEVFRGSDFCLKEHSMQTKMGF